jgi:hypothetical protein
MEDEMKKVVLLLVLLSLTSVSSVFAVTGGAYLQACASLVPGTTGYIRCGSYVLGVIDNMRAQKAGDIGYKDVCFPEKMEEEQLIQMAVDWLGTNPESLTHWAAFGVSMAMYDNFKCGCDDPKPEPKAKP